MSGPYPAAQHRPLSDMQQSMLAHEAFQGVPLYNVARLFRLDGPLDAGALREAFRHVVRRHAVLRCTYDADHAVAAGENVPLPDLELRTAAAGAAATPVPSAVWEAPFRPAAEVPVRASLTTHAPGEHHLALCLHHVVVDSWSLTLLLRDLGTAYAALLRGHRPDDGPAPDFFAVAARGQAGREAAGWWREYLAGVRPQPHPRSEPPPEAEQGTHTCVELCLDAVRTRGVRELARRTRVTPATVLFTAVSKAVAGTGASEESVLGLPAALRETAEQQETMGPLLNTLPVRTSWRGSPTGAELVRAHHASVTAALAHKDVPYSRIRKAARLPRGTAPYLHVVNVDNGSARLRLPRVRVTPLPVAPRWAVFPAHWVFGWGTVGNIDGVLRAGLDHFTPGQAAAQAARFHTSLDRLLCGS